MFVLCKVFWQIMMVYWFRFLIFVQIINRIYENKNNI